MQLPEQSYQKIKPPKSWLKFLIPLMVVGVSVGGYYLITKPRFITIGTATIGTAANAIDPTPTPEPSEEQDNPMPQPNKDQLNVLILGIRGEDDLQDGGLLTDTMLIASINKKTGRNVLISIPRDLYINMLGVHGKINSAYEHGYQQRQGIPIASEIVSRITHLYINKAIVFDFKAFGTIIDTLGGIDVTLAQPFQETQQWGYTFSLPAGKNHLNGEQALYYARSRFSSSDFDRTRRQQQIIQAIKEKAAALGLLSSSSKVLDLFTSLKDHIKTNFQVWDIQDGFSLVTVLSNNKPQQYQITTDNYLLQTKTPQGEYILLPKSHDYKDIQQFIEKITTSGEDKH